MERGFWLSCSFGKFPGVSGDKARCLRIRGSSKEPTGNRNYGYIVIYSNVEMAKLIRAIYLHFSPLTAIIHLSSYLTAQ